MSKKEIIEKLKYWRVQIVELREFINMIRHEKTVVKLGNFPVSIFLNTATEYLEANLREIEDRLRMS